MHILIAPNAFKNALSASDAAKFILEGLKMSKLKFTSTAHPVADGGDGTGELLIKKANALLINAIVSDPLGRKINASFGLTNDGTAIIELADTCGLRLMKPSELKPLEMATNGAGELVKIALDKKAKCILFCIGGSCTTDGGTGILQALGMRFLNRNGNELKKLPECLTQLEAIDSSRLDARIKETELIILCDVRNTLLGKKGAAAIFGPQKGADQNDVKKLEACLERLRDVALYNTGKDMAALQHGGAAGGVAAGLAVFLNARLVSGADYFLSYTRFAESLQNANLVITGEGSIDDQTLQGKAPFAVAISAKVKGIPVIALAGKISLMPDYKLHGHFEIMMPIGNEPVEIETALENTSQNLMRTAKVLGDLLALKIRD